MRTGLPAIALLLLSACTMMAQTDKPRGAPRGPNLSAVVECLKQSNTALAVAYRGQVSPDAPENSLKGMAEALADGALTLQLDVRRSADGELLLLHDPSLDRTTTGTGLLSGKSFAEIRQVQLKTRAGYILPEPPPTIDEALLYAKRRGAIVVLSPKGHIPPGMLIEALYNNAMAERVIILAESPEDAVQYANSISSVIIGIGTTSPATVRHLIDRGVPANRLVAYLPESAINTNIINDIRAMGVASMAGPATANTPLTRGVSASLSFILTSQPGQITNMLVDQEIEGAECFISAQ